jgi:putative lipoprotein (rSAM/lipoprotein system)
VPLSHFKITGTVQSADQSLPVKGLSVSVSDTMNTFINIDSTKTDSLGRYLLNFLNAHRKNMWNLKVKDIDSMENGSFIMKDTIVSIPADSELNVDLKVDRSNQ